MYFLKLARKNNELQPITRSTNRYRRGKSRAIEELRNESRVKSGGEGKTMFAWEELDARAQLLRTQDDCDSEVEEMKEKERFANKGKGEMQGRKEG